jgi:hypothetical protein
MPKTEAAGLHCEPNAIIASRVTDRGHPAGWRGRLQLRNIRSHKECCTSTGLLFFNALSVAHNFCWIAGSTSLYEPSCPSQNRQLPVAGP